MSLEFIDKTQKRKTKFAMAVSWISKTEKAQEMRSRMKVMLTMFFDVFVASRIRTKSINSDKTYYQNILRRLRDAVQRFWKQKIILSVGYELKIMLYVSDKKSLENAGLENQNNIVSRSFRQGNGRDYGLNIIIKFVWLPWLVH